MESSVRRGKTRQQIEEELLNGVEEAKKRYGLATGVAKETARRDYEIALERFNELILRGKLLENG